MSNEKPNLCRMCLNAITDKKYEIIDVTRDTLNNLSFKFNLTKDDIICCGCSEKTTGFLNFKSTCLYVEDKINNFINPGDASQVCLNNVYPEEKHGKAIFSLMKSEKICRFCLRLAIGNFKEFHLADKEIMFIMKMVSEHIPELNLKFTKRPIACEHCYNFLELFFNFINDCLVKRNELTENFEDNRDSSGDAALTELAYIEMKKECSENVAYPGEEIKKEVCVNVEEQNTCVKIERDLETNRWNIISGATSSTCVKNDENEMKFEADQRIRFSPEKVQALTYSHGTFEEKAADLDDSIQGNRDRPSQTTRKYRCNLCDFRTTRNHTLKMHKLVHEDPSQVEMLKCPVCEFTTKWKCSLKTHMIAHKNPLETKMHKCNKCSFETRHSSTLKTHLTTHLDPSERPTFNCTLCNFKTTRKYSLKVHNLEHENPSEVKLLWCDLCGFKTKWKRSFKNHILTHKSDSEVVMHRCHVCHLETRHGSVLKRHMVTHSEPSESDTFRCDSCDFTTRWKFSLKKHNLVHEHPSRIETFACDLCGHETSRKSSLKTHMLTHKDPSQIKMHKCDTCGFETRHACTLKTQKLTHLDASKREKFKCDSCDFRTVRKYSLKMHSLLHGDPSKVKTFSCEVCGHTTKRKRNLKKHMLTHRGDSEVDGRDLNACVP